MRTTSARRGAGAVWLFAAVCAALLAGCDGGGGTGDGGAGADGAAFRPDGAGAADLGPDGARDAGATPEDAAADGGPARDLGGGGSDVPMAPDLPAADVPTGSGALGDPCTSGFECQSGLCWANGLTTGCTLACAADADCAPLGGQCRRLAEGPGDAVAEGCGPPSMSGNPTCEDHDDCLWPYVCRTDVGWCELPECRYDADCPADRHCDLRSRRCTEDVCTNTIECTFPLDVCLDGACGPPQCAARADCPAGQICARTTGRCEEATPCPDGECGFYNLVCVDGLCEPNPCGGNGECPGGQTCDPQSGCYRPCAGAHDCPNGLTCDTGRGRCYQNRPPVAIAGVRRGGAVLAAANVSRGTTVTLDASASVDPDGTALDYRWRLDDAPPGATLALGAPLPGVLGATPTWQPPGPGRWAVGLVVVDAAGSASQPIVVIVNVLP